MKIIYVATGIDISKRSHSKQQPAAVDVCMHVCMYIIMFLFHLLYSGTLTKRIGYSQIIIP